MISYYLYITLTNTEQFIVKQKAAKNCIMKKRLCEAKNKHKGNWSVVNDLRRNTYVPVNFESSHDDLNDFYCSIGTN